MAGELSWSLGTSRAYIAREELDVAVRITAPEHGNYYIVGALYSAEMHMYSGSLFGLLTGPDGIVARNSLSTMSVFSLEGGVELDLTGRLVLSNTDCVLALFLYELLGDEANLDTDMLVDSISAMLVSPVTEVKESMNEIVIAMMTMVIIVMMFPAMTKAVGKGE